MMMQRNVFDNRQPDAASALFLSRGGDPVEAFEDAVLMLRWNAAAVIFDTEIHLSILPARGEFDLPGPAVNDSIGNQIVQRLEEKLGVAEQFRGIAVGDLQFDSGGFRGGPADLHGAAEHGQRLNRKKIILRSPAHVFQRSQGQKVQQKRVKANLNLKVKI